MPPPTLEKPNTEPLALDHQAVSPAEPDPFLKRAFGEKIKFSVKSAISPLDRDPNLYWYVDFKYGDPSVQQSEIDPFDLEGCSVLVEGNGPETYIVEVLVTEGVIAIDTSITDADPRFTVNGEPILEHTWAVQVTGVGDLDCKEGNAVN